MVFFPSKFGVSQPHLEGSRGACLASSVFEGLKDGSNDCIDIVHHIVVPKTNDLVALGLEKACAVVIVIHLVKMLASIQLNYEPGCWGAKIRDIGADRMLAAKRDPELIISQDRPEFAFGRCVLFAKFHGEVFYF